MRRFIALALCLSVVVGCCILFTACNKEDPYAQFEQFNLDTSTEVNLNFYGFLDNFEGMESVIVGFEKLFNNCTINYQSLGTDYANILTSKMLEDPTSTHLYMTTSKLFGSSYLNSTEYATDYLAADTGINLSEINAEYTAYEKVGDSLYTVPLMINTRAMAVNKTLLANHNLDVPQNWGQFLNACRVLKAAGMTPIQCDPSLLGQCLIYPYIASSMVNGPTYEADLAEANSKVAGSGRHFKNAFAKLITICQKENAFYSATENATLTDNYDSAIKNFFEGDVAFFPCTAESYSGFSKREKAEGSQYNGFAYDYVGSPMGDSPSAYYLTYDGVAINPKATNYNWAKAFAQYLFNGENMNTLAEAKGMLANTTAEFATDSKYSSLKALPAAGVAYSSKFKTTFFSQLGYTYEKIYGFDKRIYGNPYGSDTGRLASPDGSWADSAVAYYESKL